jgi:integrase
MPIDICAFFSGVRMSRPRRDGTPAKLPSKTKLNDRFVTSQQATDRDRLTWDTHQPGLALMVRATGRKSWLVVYRHHSRPVRLHLGDARSIPLTDARRLTAKIMLQVAEGKDPAAERKAQRMAGTFADLAGQYVELWSKRHNKSWPQAKRLVDRHLIPRWGKLKADAVVRADVRALMARIEAPIVANQTLAAASAIFSWAVKQEILTVNPCRGVERNGTHARERVLSDAEVAILWPKLDPALRLILLTGQRPGEVMNMQREHVADGWWQMPGKPQGNWPGTKNARDHRVALSEFAQTLTGQQRGGKLDKRMRELVVDLKIERATPHDLRRTCLTWITRLGFGRDAMDRIANHRTSSVTDVYDRHGYGDEDRRIMAAVARHLIGIIEGTATSNVISLR